MSESWRIYPEDWRTLVEVPLVILAVPLSAVAHVHFASGWLDAAMLVGFLLAGWWIARPIDLGGSP